MALTWKQFTDLVTTLITVDGDRLGMAAAYVPLQIKLAVQDLQRFIPSYRTGMQTLITPAELSGIGFASSGDLPSENCQIRDCYVLRFKYLMVGSVATATDIFTITAHGLDSGDVVSLRAASTATLPAGATAGKFYYARVIDADTLTLHETETGSDDGTLMLNVTDGGSGVFYLDYDLRRHPVSDKGWDVRHEMTSAQDCIISNSALMAINPAADEFIIYPRLPVVDDDGFTYLLELNWDGPKTAWNDADATPFTEQTAEAVALYVKANIKREGDMDESMRRSYVTEYAAKRSNLYLDGKKRKRTG